MDDAAGRVGHDIGSILDQIGRRVADFLRAADGRLRRVPQERGDLAANPVGLGGGHLEPRLVPLRGPVRGRKVLLELGEAPCGDPLQLRVVLS